MMNLVWTRSAHKGSELLLLLAIADNADDDGFAYPGIELLARKTRLTARAVQYALQKLLTADDCEIEVVRRGGRGRTRKGEGRANEYQISTKTLRHRPDAIGFRLDEADGKSRTKHSSPQPSVEPSDNLGASPLAENSIAEIYGYWRQQRGKTRANYDAISEARRKKIKTRLDEFSVDDLKRAIDGVGCDPWKERASHDDLTIIFRSREQVEKFLDLAEQGSSRPRGLSPQEIARRAVELGEQEKAA